MKEQLRSQALKQRTSLTGEQVKRYSNQIFKQLISIDTFEQAATVFVYMSYNNEVDTKLIIEYLLATDRRVCIPFICGQGIMEAIEIKSLNDTKPNRYGIPEPIDCSNIVQPEQINVALVPACVYDVNCNRIGYGKGFYDNYLTSKNIYTIGLAYDFQIVDTIPAQQHDVKLNMVVTPTKIIK